MGQEAQPGADVLAAVGACLADGDEGVRWAALSAMEAVGDQRCTSKGT